MKLPVDDQQLVAAVLAGDESSFRQLADRYQSALFRAARSRLGRDDWAEEVVQETFLCVHRWLRSYNADFGFRTWLWTILINQCRRYLKKQSRVVLAVDFAGSSIPDQVRDELAQRLHDPITPPMNVLAKERAELLDALLLRLPENQADALRLRFFGGLTFPEIASAMQCSLSTAKNRVKWGLERMALWLTPDQSQSGSNMTQRQSDKT